MNFGKEVLHVIGSLAPTVATAVGGPFAGAAVTALTKALGLDSGATSDQQQDAIATAAMSGDPATLLKFKEAEQNFTATMAQLGIKKEELIFDDIDSARKMEEATKDDTPRQLAWLIVGGFIAISVSLIVLFVLFPQRAALIDAAAWTMIGTLLGFFGSEAKQVCSFYFGSSSDSQAKTKTLSEIAKS